MAVQAAIVKANSPVVSPTNSPPGASPHFRCRFDRVIDDETDENDMGTRRSPVKGCSPGASPQGRHRLPRAAASAATTTSTTTSTIKSGPFMREEEKEDLRGPYLVGRDHHCNGLLVCSDRLSVYPYRHHISYEQPLVCSQQPTPLITRSCPPYTSCRHRGKNWLM